MKVTVTQKPGHRQNPATQMKQWNLLHVMAKEKPLGSAYENFQRNRSCKIKQLTPEMKSDAAPDNEAVAKHNYSVV